MSNRNETCTDPDFGSLAARSIVKRKDDILCAWEARIRIEIELAANLSEPILIDTLPLFVENLARALDAGHFQSTATETSNVAKEHGGERARVTPFGPEQILAEYQVMREVIEGILIEENCFSPTIHRQIQKSFDRAIQEAMVAFFMVHMSLRDQFVATLSHDLRNPIGAARLSADLVFRKIKAEMTELELENARRLINKIIANLQRSDQMIQYLLDTNALQVGEKLTIKTQRGDLNAFTQAIVDGLPERDRERIEYRGDTQEVFVDFDLLQRAIENLISNAFKYGDSTSKIEVEICETFGRAMISVHNLGDPIPIEEQCLLFQNLHRTPSARRSGKKGWGLGLSFVRGVCESHGGSIGMESSAVDGTRFTIDIPADARPFESSNRERNLREV